MESNNISYLILGIIIGSIVDLKLIFTIVIFVTIITNEPDFKGMRPRTLLSSIIYGIYIFILNLFYNFSTKSNTIDQNNERVKEKSDDNTELLEPSSKSLIISKNLPYNLTQSTQPKPIILNFSPISIYPASKFDKK